MAQVWRIVCIASLALGLRAADGGSIQGTVINSVTRQALPGVSVELKPKLRGLGHRTATDASGEFRFSGLDPGEYSISFDKNGFDPSEDEDSTSKVQVAPQATVRLHLEMDPLATIDGKVLDGDNHGIRRITVELLTGLGQVRKTVSTDDAGAFQVRELHPGVYLLRATPDRPAWNGKASNLETLMAPAAAASLENRALRAPAYYPGVQTMAEASAIQVNGGGEVNGFDIRMRTPATYAIRGHLLDPEGHPMAKTPVKLKSADMYYMFAGGPPDAQITTGSEGQFEFPEVTPGKWQLLAEFYPPGAGPRSRTGQVPGRLMGFTPVLVSHNDMENVTLRLSTSFALDVTVVGLPEADSVRRGPQVHLIPVDGPLEQEVFSNGPKNGKILVEGVYPGRYRFDEGGRAGYYLESILLGGRNVLGEEVELAGGALPVQMIYKQDGGKVRGTVEGGEGAFVVVVPEAQALRDEWRSGKCDEQGRFEVSDLRPGSYYVAAVRTAGALKDPFFLASMNQVGTHLQVDAGNTVPVELKVTSWPR